MLKRIPKSDISIRPFKAYKEWSFSSGSTLIDLLEADSTSTELSGLYPKNSIHGNIKSTFYNGQEDNPITRIGFKTSTFTIFTKAKERNLESYAKVISIPNIYVGEGIKRKSVIIDDDGSFYYDDGFGNLRGSNIDLELEIVNFNDDFIKYLNLENSTLTLELSYLNLETNQVIFNYNSIDYTQTIIQLDLERSILEVDELPFLDNVIGTQGNVFYNQGIIVLTKNSATKLLNNWEVSYKSTQTIYEHEYLLISNEDEFNVSTNPTAVIEVGRVTSFITGSDNKIYKTTTNPGVKYIRKKSTLENGDILDYTYSGSISSSISNTWISGGFEQYDLNSSSDSTGSFLLPFITTIGLYDDSCQLVAVAKLPQPIKSESDMPVNFIVRFDT
jgi:Leucine-rich repeat (LRR) protein